MESHEHHHTPIYILEDWEEDIWKRCYFTVKRNAAFHYTLELNEARKKLYPYALGEIHSTVLKMPKKAKVSRGGSETKATM